LLWAGRESATYGDADFEGCEVEVAHVSSTRALPLDRSVRRLRVRA